MQEIIQTNKSNGNGNGHLTTRKSRPNAADSLHNGHSSTFDPNKYMLKLPKYKKVSLPNGQVRYDKTETDYLPVAARIAWFRKDHTYWSIITKVEKWGDKAVVMKAIIKDSTGAIIATARKKETEAGFSDYIEKAETGAVGRALAMCGYGTLEAPEFDEQDRLAALRWRRTQTKLCEWSCGNTRPQRKAYERNKKILTTAQMMRRRHSSWSGIKCNTSIEATA